MILYRWRNFIGTFLLVHDIFPNDRLLTLLHFLWLLKDITHSTVSCTFFFSTALQNWELMNTAVLTGRQVSQVMKVFIATEAGKVADVTLQSSCHAEDESVIKVSAASTLFPFHFPFVVVMDDEFLIFFRHPVIWLAVCLFLILSLLAGVCWHRIHLLWIEIIGFHL